MKKGLKICLLLATSFILVGAIIFTVCMSFLGWDFNKLSTFKFQEKQYEISESFQNILIETLDTDIEFKLSTDDKTTVVCYEKVKVYHTVSAENGTLKIKCTDDRKLFDYLGFSFSSPKITVFLPSESYNDIDIKLTTGDILINNLTVNKLNIALTTGDITIKNTTCSDFTTNGTTGDITLINLIATNKISAVTSTGDIEFYLCDANEIYLKTTTGDIDGSLLTGKTFSAKTTTGDIKIPQNSSGGLCTLITTTGDISITVKN
ncbi:MAG: DUF4097 family beta strand repeat protein [Clostridia bacterium]|nr:DUF4097 family beta strand repeat protein [Clostridia bacterium]